jgi:hypothetical protein
MRAANFLHVRAALFVSFKDILSQVYVNNDWSALPWSSGNFFYLAPCFLFHFRVHRLLLLFISVLMAFLCGWQRTT